MPLLYNPLLKSNEVSEKINSKMIERNETVECGKTEKDKMGETF